MTVDTATLERQARYFVNPVLIGPEADAAVLTIVAWERVNPEADADRRERAWTRIAHVAA